MKKTLLLAILALSINAFAQQKQPSSYPIDIIRGWMENDGLKATRSQPVNLEALQQKNDSIYQWRWDYPSHGWILASKYVGIVYDTSNNLVGRLLKTFENNVWVNSEKDTNIYDASNNLKSITTKTLIDTTWVDLRQITCSYDANNNLLNYIKKNKNGSVWENSTKFSFTYDTNNVQTGQSIQNWTGSAWEDHFQYTLTYDANGVLTSYTRQNWNSFSWEFSFEVNFSFDQQNHITNASGKSWDGGGWVDTYKGTFNYDGNNNLLSFAEQKWKGGSWLNSREGADTYDANNLIKSDTYKIMSRTGTEVEGGDSTYYFNAAGKVNDFKVKEGHLNVYPNPSSGKFAISTDEEISSLEIYNLFGQRIYSGRISGRPTSAEIDLSHYSKGIYLIKYTTGDKNYTRTVVIQ